MTTNDFPAGSLVRILFTAALTIAISSCSEDKPDTTTAGNTGAGSGASAAGAKAGSTSTDPNAAAECPDKVYSALSDGCGSCACGVNPELAPSCQKPCW